MPCTPFEARDTIVTDGVRAVDRVRLDDNGVGEAVGERYRGDKGLGRADNRDHPLFILSMTAERQCCQDVGGRSSLTCSKRARRGDAKASSSWRNSRTSS